MQVDVFVPEGQYLRPGPKFFAGIKSWRRTLALPEDAGTYLLEIVKFLATGALILATGALLLMLGQ